MYCCVLIADIFLFGYMYIRARFTTVYAAYMCDYSGIGIHYVLI